MLGILDTLPCVRKFGTVDGGTQVHVFYDASMVGYGAVLSNASVPSRKLLFSKSRVAPLKTVTVPRLE